MRNFVFHKISIFFLILTLLIPSLGAAVSNNPIQTTSVFELNDQNHVSVSTTEELEADNPSKSKNIVLKSNIEFDGIQISFKAAEFDPLVSEPEIPDEFEQRFDGKTNDFILIQFVGPIKSAWKESLANIGVEFYNYIPHYAFVAYADLDLIPEIQSQEFVRWVGPFHPYYRVHPDLMDMIITGQTYSDINNQIIMISLRPVTDMPSLINSVVSIGALIEVVDDDNYVVCDLTVAMAYDLIFTHNLLWMNFHSIPELLNDKASRIVKVRQTSNGSFANSGASLWSYNHNTDTYEGHPGKDVVIAMVDSGVDGTHPTFDGKKIWFYNYGNNQENTWTDAGSAAGHGTHTSGTSLGTGAWRPADSGEAAKYAGMAPAAGLIGQAVFQGGGVPSPSRLCDDGVEHGANISSNSWGWPGTAGNYDNTAVAYDELTRDSFGQEFTIVFGTGNEGPGTIREPSTAKNVISVGATDNQDGTSVTGFSSGGPTDDDRIKPDVVAPGAMVASAGWRNMGRGQPADGQTSYFYASGTSMSTPVGAGSCAVIFDYVNHTYGYEPSPALIKALLVNGATPIDGYTYPGNRQGWGKINVANSLLETPTKKIFFVNQNITLDTDEDLLYFFNTKSSGGSLRISLVWTDKAGAPNSDPNLVNDLDLILESPDGNTYYGNNFQNGKSVDGIKPDTLNNVEGLYVPNVPAGGWILTVSAINIPDGPQDFALVIAGDITEMIKGIRDIEALPSISFPDKTHLEGDTIYINGSFKNVGSIPTINVRYRIVHIDENLFEENLVDKTLSILQIDEIFYINYYWPAVRGQHTFKVVIDPFNTIREESEENNDYEQSIFIDHYGLEASSDVEERTVLPGDTIQFAILIHNTGSLEDTFSLSTNTAPTDWIAELTTDTKTISSNRTEAVSLDITPAETALANESAEITVTVVSSGNNTYTTQVMTKTIVEQFYAFQVEYITLEKSILPGVQGEYNITINNTGNGLSDYVIGTGGGKYGWMIIPPEEFVPIGPRTAENVTLKVTPPLDGLAGDECEVQIYVMDERMVPVELKTVSSIAEVYKFKLDITKPDRISDTGKNVRFPLTVHNQGNIIDIYDLKVTVPSNWTGNFSRPTIDIHPTENNKIFLNVKVPGYEFPDVYTIDFSLKSKATNLVQNYSVSIELNQLFDINAKITPINDRVYQGQTATYMIEVTNFGTGEDSVKIEYITIPPDWRVYFDKSVLGLTFSGKNSTNIMVKTDVLATDGSYKIDLKITSAGNDSKVIYQSLETVLDHTLEFVTDGPDDSDDATSAGFLEENMLYILIIVIIVVVIIVAFLFMNSKKKNQKADKLKDERIQKEQAVVTYQKTYSTLYGEDHKSSIKPPKPYDFLEPSGPQMPLPAPSPAGSTDSFFAVPKPQRAGGPGPSAGRQLPLGPLPTSDGRKPSPKGPVPQLPGRVEPYNDMQKKKRRESWGGSPGKVDVTLPSDFRPGEEEQEFESIKPKSSKDKDFEQKGPQYVKSSPMEWESVDEYEKGFQFGSGPELIDADGKKKKKR